MHTSEEYVQLRTERLRKDGTGPGKHWHVAVDETNGNIAGFAAWNAPGDWQGHKDVHVDAVDPDVNPALCDEQLNTVVRQGLTEMRRNIMGDRSDYWYLATLGVHPDYQGRGVAKMLLQHGLRMADEEHKDVYLASSPAAFPLYQKLDFRELGRLPLLGGRYVLTGMLRYAR
ncbi:hypothetical protein BAUCODRAFT_74925, partial [Baudoinia panamericana UAMH 10762]